MGGCPVRVDIPGFIKLIAEGHFAAAARKIKQTNVLPAICGRVCPQEEQCEGKCVLGKRWEPVAIGRLERFAADYEREHNLVEIPPQAPSNGKRVGVVGSGPAGLTVAADLIALGYQVTVFEAFHKPGGVLVYGIPEFRLPKAIVRDEVDYLRRQGVRFEMNQVVGKTIRIEELLGDEGLDAVFIGVGAGLPWFIGIPGENLGGVCSANEYLGDQHGMVRQVRCQPMTLGEPDASGRRRPVPVQGGMFLMDSDLVIVAIGSVANTVLTRETKNLEANQRGYIVTDGKGHTPHPRIWAGGDIVTGSATVIRAMGAGKQAGEDIHRILSGQGECGKQNQTS